MLLSATETLIDNPDDAEYFSEESGVYSSILAGPRISRSDTLSLCTDPTHLSAEGAALIIVCLVRNPSLTR
jgi:hypothetical protein